MKKKLFHGVIWVTGARISINLLGLVSTLVLARLLTPSDFGLIAIAMAIVTIASSISELSLASALVQHENPTDSHYDTAFTLNVMRSTILGVFVVATSWYAAALFKESRLVLILHAIAISIMITGFNNPRIIQYTRNLEFWPNFAIDVSGKIVSVITAIIIAYVYKSYWALIISIITMQLHTFALSYLLIPFRPRLTLSSWRELLGFSSWISFSQAVNTLNWRSDNLFIGYFLGSRSAGYYTFGDNLASLPTREATAPIAQTLFPAFSRLREDQSRLRFAYQSSQAMLSALAFPIGFGFALLAEPLVMVTVGAKWEPAILVIQMLAGVFTLQTLASSAQPLAMALGETRLLFNVSIVNLLLRLPLIMIGIMTAGLVGVLYARMCSGLIGTVINMLLVRRLLHLSIFSQLQINLPSFFATAIMCAALLLWPLVILNAGGVGSVGSVAMMIILGGAIYVAARFALWLVAGKPVGPETEALTLVKRVRATAFSSPTKDAAP